MQSPEPGHGIAWTELAGCEVACDWSGCLYWPVERLLVVSDLHLEKGASLAARGHLAPPYDTLTTLERLAHRLAEWQPRIVVALGDSFHAEQASARMPEIFRQRLSSLMVGRDWIWIAGNHDPSPPAELGGTTADEICLGPLRFRHEPLAGSPAGELSGHLHPVARIVRRGRAVRRPCFAEDGARMILPAFGAFTGGLNLRDRAFAGLFADDRLVAHVTGRARIYRIAFQQLS
jgi:DNA ligase-associated metallophosphoesterase